ncbi:MAG: hypothetical protein LBP53_03445 [Candidatus Peribacteria bacterium]|nr:hypothetical protein [Candidatus Peribacteria bacterium]
MKITDWESIVAEGSFKERVTNATTYTFTTLKEEIPASVDAWIAQYGLPADISTTEKPIVV